MVSLKYYFQVIRIWFNLDRDNFPPNQFIKEWSYFLKSCGLVWPSSKFGLIRSD